MIAFPIGSKAELQRTFTEADVRSFAELSGDDNPIHLDPAYAARTLFERPIVHGALLGSLVSAVLGTRLPGLGAIYLEQSLKFKKPVFVGDTVIARATVTEVREEKSIYFLETNCWRNGDLVVEGKAVIKYLPV